MDTTRTPGFEPRPVRRALTPEQQHLADELQRRAQRLRSISEDGLSIREAVELAAVQLGVAP